MAINELITTRLPAEAAAKLRLLENRRGDAAAISDGAYERLRELSKDVERARVEVTQLQAADHRGELVRETRGEWYPQKAAAGIVERQSRVIVRDENRLARATEKFERAKQTLSEQQARLSQVSERSATLAALIEEVTDWVQRLPDVAVIKTVKVSPPKMKKGERSGSPHNGRSAPPPATDAAQIRSIRKPKGIGVATKKQMLGDAGETFVSKHCACRRCKRKSTLKRLPPNFKCADLICDFCGWLAQVKTASVKTIDILPDTILGAAWAPQKERMDAGIYIPLYIVLDGPSGAKNVFFLSVEAQEPSMFVPRKPLSSSAKRAGWQGFIYDLRDWKSHFLRAI